MHNCDASFPRAFAVLAQATLTVPSACMRVLTEIKPQRKSKYRKQPAKASRSLGTSAAKATASPGADQNQASDWVEVLNFNAAATLRLFHRDDAWACGMCPTFETVVAAASCSRAAPHSACHILIALCRRRMTQWHSMSSCELRAIVLPARHVTQRRWHSTNPPAYLSTLTHAIHLACLPHPHPSMIPIWQHCPCSRFFHDLPRVERKRHGLCSNTGL